MTLKDVQRRHEDRLYILPIIVRRSYETPTDALQPDADGRFVKLASRLINDLEAERDKDFQLVTEFQSAQEIPNPCKGVGSNHANLISAQEAEAALRGPKTATDIPTAHYRSIYDGNVIRSSQETHKTTQTPITSLEELDNLYQQIREQFIKSHP